MTTSSFTRQAEQEVASLYSQGQMVLVDGVKLVAFIREYWDVLPAQWQWRLTECMVERDRQRECISNYPKTEGSSNP